MVCSVAALAAAGYYVYSTSRASVKISGYQVIEKDGAFEVRKYPAMRVVSTTLGSDNDAFMRLFRFISGANVRKEKIAMTAPVFMDGRHTMSFVLPEEVAASGAPLPTGDAVTLGERPAAKVIAVRYSGAGNAASEERELARLRAWAAERGIATEGETIVAYYDSPFVPGFLRRNEVLLRVKG
jgi:hypothetical protein